MTTAYLSIYLAFFFFNFLSEMIYSFQHTGLVHILEILSLSIFIHINGITYKTYFSNCLLLVYRNTVSFTIN